MKRQNLRTAVERSRSGLAYFSSLPNFGVPCSDLNPSWPNQPGDQKGHQLTNMPLEKYSRTHAFLVLQNCLVQLIATPLSRLFLGATVGSIRWSVTLQKKRTAGCFLQCQAMCSMFKDLEHAWSVCFVLLESIDKERPKPSEHPPKLRCTEVKKKLWHHVV